MECVPTHPKPAAIPDLRTLLVHVQLDTLDTTIATRIAGWASQAGSVIESPETTCAMRQNDPNAKTAQKFFFFLSIMPKWLLLSCKDSRLAENTLIYEARAFARARAHTPTHPETHTHTHTHAHKHTHTRARTNTHARARTHTHTLPLSLKWFWHVTFLACVCLRRGRGRCVWGGGGGGGEGDLLLEKNIFEHMPTTVISAWCENHSGAFFKSCFSYLAWELFWRVTQEHII